MKGAVFLKQLIPLKLRGQLENNRKITANISTQIDRFPVYEAI